MGNVSVSRVRMKRLEQHALECDGFASTPKNGAIWEVCHHLVRIHQRHGTGAAGEFRALIDGNGPEEQPDGTILVHGKKSYPNPDDGLGAIWRDVWITPDGKVVREGEITLRGSDL